MNRHGEIIEEAARWHLASQGEDMDWDAFTLWLEADPAHARAFDEVALTGAAVDELALDHSATLAPANDAEAPAIGTSSSWWRWAGGAIAASLVAVIGVTLMRPDAPSVYSTQGEPMTVALDDGSSVVLAPDSRLTVSGAQLALEGGAYFDIRHDPARQMQVNAGALTITDIGTQFDVQVTPADVRVAVGEGQVQVRSAQLSAPVDLQAGRQLHFDATHGRSLAAPVESAAVGGWRTGMLSYDDAPLALVSADLGRYAGVELEVPDELADRSFSGTLAIDDGNSAIRDLAQLMGLGVERVAGGYRLSSTAD